MVADGFMTPGDVRLGDSHGKNTAERLTQYGIESAVRKLDFWRHHGLTNRARLEKVIDRYKELEMRKGEIYALNRIFDLFGIDLTEVQRMFPELFTESPEEQREKEERAEMVRKMWRELEREDLFSSLIMSGYHSVEQFRFAAQLFNRLELMPLAKFFEGCGARHDLLRLQFENDWELRIWIESFEGDDLARELECRWQLLQRAVIIREGNFVDLSRRNSAAIASQALTAALTRVHIGGEEAPAEARWQITDEESMLLYRHYGPFSAERRKEGADICLMRKDGEIEGGVRKHKSNGRSSDLPFSWPACARKDDLLGWRTGRSAMNKETAETILDQCESLEQRGIEDKTRTGVGLILASKLLRLFVGNNYQPVPGRNTHSGERQTPLPTNGTPLGMDFLLCLKDEQPAAELQLNGTFLKCVTLDECVDLLLSLMSRTGYPPTYGLRQAARLLDNCPRKYEAERLGEAGDGSIMELILMRRDI